MVGFIHQVIIINRLSKLYDAMKKALEVDRA